MQVLLTVAVDVAVVVTVDCPDVSVVLPLACVALAAVDPVSRSLMICPTSRSNGVADPLVATEHSEVVVLYTLPQQNFPFGDS